MIFRLILRHCRVGYFLRRPPSGYRFIRLANRFALWPHQIKLITQTLLTLLVSDYVVRVVGDSNAPSGGGDWRDIILALVTKEFLRQRRGAFLRLVGVGRGISPRPQPQTGRASFQASGFPD